MTQVIRVAEGRAKILEELQKYKAEFPTGPGMASGDLKGRVGLTKSPNTFNKCIHDLATDDLIETGIRDPENYAKKLIRLTSDEAKAELAFLEAVQKIQTVSSLRISAQSHKEYSRIAQAMLPDRLDVDDLNQQPYPRIRKDLLELVAITHQALAKCLPDVAEDAYLQSRPSDLSIQIMSPNAAKTLARHSFTLMRILNAAAENSILMSLLDEIPGLDPGDLVWPGHTSAVKA
jgi:hypothetical protein